MKHVNVYKSCIVLFSQYSLTAAGSFPKMFYDV